MDLSYAVLNLLMDTSVWLDLAKRRDGQKWIVAMRLLMQWEQLRLLVPDIVVDEFERNRERVAAAMSSSVAERFRLLRRDLDAYGNEKHENARYVLDGLAHEIPLIGAMATRNCTDIVELLKNGDRLEAGVTEMANATRRALEKRAPFHRGKNSAADAVLIEAYGAAAKAATEEDRFVFATSNHDDFSAAHDDRRRPHEDIAEFFSMPVSQYCYQLDGLDAALAEHFGDEYLDLLEESDFQEEPRTLDEILGAEQEYFDKVWYVRKLILEEKIERGESAPLMPEIAEQAHAAMRAIEDRYGVDNVGPWSDWEWGFVNGKLSALRWVLGSEWDFLDT